MAIKRKKLAKHLFCDIIRIMKIFSNEVDSTLVVTKKMSESTLNPHSQKDLRIELSAKGSLIKIKQALETLIPNKKPVDNCTWEAELSMRATAKNKKFVDQIQLRAEALKKCLIPFFETVALEFNPRLTYTMGNVEVILNEMSKKEKEDLLNRLKTIKPKKEPLQKI